MTAMKITRRIIDPITFVERVGIEFIPRIEDNALDDQLAGSMSYAPPKNWPRPPPPPPPSSPPTSPLSSDTARPPTPPKQRAKLNPNSPRSSSYSPVGTPHKLSKNVLLSPQIRTKRKSLTLAQIGEDQELSEGSMSDMSALQTSVSKVEAAEAKAKVVKCVRFKDEHEMNEISRLRNSMIEEMFWASEDLANFRYEAFMEEAGLDIEEFG